MARDRGWESPLQTYEVCCSIQPSEGHAAVLPKPLLTAEGQAQWRLLVPPAPASGPAHGEEDEWEPLPPYSCQGQGGCRRELWG